MEDWTVCRLCLQSSEETLKFISGCAYNSQSYGSIYFMVTGITLTDYKSFPTQICTVCEENMINAYNFRELCYETEEKLRELEESSNEKPQPSDPKATPTTVSFEGDSVEENTEDVNEENDTCATEEKLPPPEPKERRILCKRCKVIFKGLESFKVHRCKTERKVQPKEAKLAAKACNVCGKVIKGSHYVQHMDYHNNIKRYECEHCGEKFFWWTARRTHIYREHLKRKLCKCPHCPMEFYITGQMTVHIKEVHSVVPDYQCEKCGKEFRIRRSLRKHALTHMEGGVCSYCGKVYGNRLRLLNHLTRIHGKRAKADCPICSKTLRTISILRSHFKKVHPTQMHLFPKEAPT